MLVAALLRSLRSPASHPARWALLAAVDPAGSATVDLAATISPLHCVVCVAAIALAGLGALAATSLIGYSPNLLAAHLEEQEHPDRERITADFARNDAEYLAVAMIYTVAGWIVGLWALGNAIDAPNQGWAVALFGALMLLVAGSLPVAIAQARAERTLLATRRAVRAGWRLLRWPLVVPLVAATRLCIHALRIRPAAASNAAEVQKQVMAAVADSTEATLAGEERAWIGNIVALKDLQVSTVMTPRPDVIGFPEDLPLQQAIQQALEHGFSRYPVYRGRIDEIVGIFYVKDALRLLHDAKGGLADKPIATMVREVLLVPETMGAAQLLRRFQAGHQHMAIVLDEYGTTAGVVSVEDVLEQIVGDIGDEYDGPDAHSPAPDQIRVIEAGRVLEIPARATVAEVNQQLGTDLPEDGDWETVAGLVIAKCSHIPRVDEKVVVGDVEFRVLLADERRVLRLRATALGVQPAEETR
jgi:magnesium and cobalt transporter